MSFGSGELLLVFLAVLILFGPRRLPEAARTIGRFTEMLRRASQDFRSQVMNMERESVVDSPALPSARESEIPAAQGMPSGSEVGAPEAIESAPPATTAPSGEDGAERR